MFHNLVCCRIHMVWSTRDRQPLIPESAQQRLWSYLHATAENLGLESFAFGGVEDHVHGLIGLNAVMKISEVVQKLKANSSRWMNEEFKADFAWQKNYCVHSVGVSQMKATMDYIRNQQQHHARRDYREEMRILLRRLGVAGQDIFI